MNSVAHALKHNTRLKKISLSYIVSALARGSGFLFTFTTTPILLNYLGKDGFGLWSIFIQFFSFAAFSDFGLSNGLHNTLLKARHTENEANNILLIQRTFLLLVCIALTILVLTSGPIFLFDWISILNIKNSQLQSTLLASIVTISLLFFLNVPIGIIQKVQFAYMDHHKVYSWEVFSKILAIIMIFSAINLKLSIPFLLACFFLPIIIANIFNILTYKKLRVWKISKQSLMIHNSQVLSVARKGGLFFVMSIFYALGRTTDNFVIGSFGSLEQVTDYQILARLFDIPLLLVMMLSAIMWSAFAESIHKNEYKWVKKTMTQAIYFILITMFCFLMAFQNFGETLLSLWLGQKTTINFSLLYSMAAWTTVGAISNLLSSYLNATDRLLFQIKVFAVYFIIAFPLKAFILKKVSLEAFVLAGTIAFFLILIIPSALIIYKDLKLNLTNKNASAL